MEHDESADMTKRSMTLLGAISMSVFFLAFQRHHLPQFYSSVIFAVTGESVPLRLVLSILESAIMSFAWTTNLSYSNIWPAMCTCFVFWLKQIRQDFQFQYSYYKIRVKCTIPSFRSNI